MRITRRDVGIAAVAILCGWGAGALAQQHDVLGPAVWDWNKLAVKKTDVGEIRDLVRRPTATLDELEMHVTTLNPGLSSHPPHTHPNEELVIIDTGTVETLSGGKWERLGPGSVIFNASNAPHALRNAGGTPATYHVINWKTAATPAK
ncbi:cupin domain-containing protein [Sphingomonas kyeonggiensis]|uniref:Quercetin dioxygenase-like cupin family protein n=1 Tax=Sphingomonas kyeonggiensis TaxID=1268553 RepID=A0A7W6JRH2_9SPHN|nr:cupin domain-containing protein [Sphingomonas kyeonggiensis]MBB4098217.1 quercetin dioxygenase-like cupin family protein [Sphingomonas kyeonggiensis]